MSKRRFKVRNRFEAKRIQLRKARAKRRRRNEIAHESRRANR